MAAAGSASNSGSADSGVSILPVEGRSSRRGSMPCRGGGREGGRGGGRGAQFAQAGDDLVLPSGPVCPPAHQYPPGQTHKHPAHTHPHTFSGSIQATSTSVATVPPPPLPPSFTRPLPASSSGGGGGSGPVDVHTEPMHCMLYAFHTRTLPRAAVHTVPPDEDATMAATWPLWGRLPSGRLTSRILVGGRRPGQSEGG